MSNDGPNKTDRTIDLVCGGTVTLTIDANLFELDPADRVFVFGLVDALAKYQQDIDDAEEREKK